MDLRAAVFGAEWPFKWLLCGRSHRQELAGCTQSPTAARGDPQAGQEIYARCIACHALAYDRTGPRHCGLIGRRAGSVKDFPYSAAMRRSKIVWGEKTLDRFLANPLQAVPGTSMGYAGITDSKERADLIAYLGRVNTSSECRKLPRPPRAD